MIAGYDHTLWHGAALALALITEMISLPFKLSYSWTGNPIQLSIAEDGASARKIDTAVLSS
jgi:hypothetical protein